MRKETPVDQCSSLAGASAPITFGQIFTTTPPLQIVIADDRFPDFGTQD